MAVMTRIHIRETTLAAVAAAAVLPDDQPQRDGAKSPSPARRAVVVTGGGVGEKDTGTVGGEAAKRPGVSDESGYFEEEELMAASLQAEDSVEIIFDKNATNNNLGPDGRSPNTGIIFAIFPPVAHFTQRI